MTTTRISEPDENHRIAMRYSLQSLLLWFVVLGAAISAFGAWGLLIALGLLAVAACFRIVPLLPKAIKMVLLGIACCCCVGGVFWLSQPAINLAKLAGPKGGCLNHLKMIWHALDDCRRSSGSFPPAFTVGPSGDRLLSWRVLILPYLDERAIYSQYRFVEKWDGPNNVKLPRPKHVFDCPSYPVSSEETNYFAVVGKNAAWHGEKPLKLSDLPDRGSRTIILVEKIDSQISWSEPRDLTIEEAISAIQGGGPHSKDISYFYDAQPGVTHVLFGDGRVRDLRANLPRDLVEALLSVDKKQLAIESTDIDSVIESTGASPTRNVRWDRIVSLFVLTATSIVLLSRAIYLKPGCRRH